MSKNILAKTALLWLTFIPIAFINGALRNFIYKPYVGDLVAHQISTFIAVIALFCVSYAMLKDTMTKTSTIISLVMGLLLVAATVLFEFGFGHYIAKNTWEQLFNDYNVLKGRVWGLLLLSVSVTPYFIKKLTENKNGQKR